MLRPQRSNPVRLDAEEAEGRVSYLRELVDEGHRRRAKQLLAQWLLQMGTMPGAAPLHQLNLRLLREDDAPVAAMETSLRELATTGQLQSWRDTAALAELELATGGAAEAKRLADEGLAAIRGRPRHEEARTALRDLSARAGSRLDRDESKKRRGGSFPGRAGAAPRTDPAPPPIAMSAAGPTSPGPADDRAAETIDLSISVTVDQPDPTLVTAVSEPEPEALLDRALLLRARRLAVVDQFGDLLCLSTMQGVQRMPHQIDTVKRVLKTLRGRALLADEVGLGKTVEAAMVFAEYRARGLVDTTLVLAPASLVGQWQAELAAKFGLALASTDDDEFRADPDGFWARHPRIVASLESARSTRHADQVAARSWDLVIVDEAHRLKNRRTLGWKLCDRLRSRFLLLLTATPVENDLVELYNVIDLLRPGQLATLAEFKKQFMTRGDPTTPRNADELRRRLGEVMIRNTRALADVRLPPRFARTVRVPQRPREAELYGRIRELLRARYDRGSERLSLATLLEEAGSSPQAVRATCERMLARADLEPSMRRELNQIVTLTTSAGGTGKGEALLAIIEAARAAGEKSVVFSRFRASLGHIEELLAARGIPYAAFHGGRSAREKDAAITAFAADTPVMLVSEAGSEGLNLQVASTLVNFDLPWNPMKLEQRIGRVHRIGQTREVHVHNLCSRGTAEEGILDVLDRRINMFELVVGELDMILGRMETEDDRDFDARIVDIYGTAGSDDEVAAGFTRLGDELEDARQRYTRSQALDKRLFGREFEV